MFYGWGTDHRTKQVDDSTVAVCRFRYVSLMFVFAFVWQRRWFLQGRDRTLDREVTPDEIEHLYGPGSVPSPGLWRRFGALFTAGAFVLLGLGSATVGALVDNGDGSVATADPVAVPVDADSTTPDGDSGRLLSEEADGGTGSESGTASGSTDDDEPGNGSSPPSRSPSDGQTIGVIADAETLGDVSGSYSNVKVNVVEIRSSRTDPSRFDPSQPETDAESGPDRWLYVTVDFESVDPNNWFDFDTDFVRLSVDGQTLAAVREQGFAGQSFRAEARSVESFVYGFEYGGPVDLSTTELIISDGTVPLVLPLDGSAPVDPYPVDVDPPSPISYLDGAFQDVCGFRNQITLTDVSLDLQEPPEWDVSIFSGPKRARSGHRQLIVTGYGERYEHQGCSAAHSDIDPDHFRLSVDGRPGEPVGGIFANKRGQAGDVTEFELMWEIPVDAEMFELELTGSTGDSDRAELAIGTMPTVYGE